MFCENQMSTLISLHRPHVDLSLRTYSDVEKLVKFFLYELAKRGAEWNSGGLAQKKHLRLPHVFQIQLNRVGKTKTECGKGKPILDHLM